MLDYLIYIVIIIDIYVILGASLNLIMGYTGLLSIAHAAFMAIGAYTTSLLLMNQHWNFFLTIPAGMLVAAAVSAIVAIASLRVNGDHYVIASFGFQIIITSVLLNWVDLTRGPFGLSGIPKPSLMGLSFSSNAAFLAIATAIAIICVVAAARLASSPFGQVLLAVREDETAARSVGKDVIRVKVIVFVVGGALAAVGGSLYASIISYIDPFSFSVHESIFLLTIVIVGGSGNILGSVLGAVVLIALPEGLRYLALPSTVAVQLRQIVFGLMLVLFIRFRPTGLLRERSATRLMTTSALPAVPALQSSGGLGGD